MKKNPNEELNVDFKINQFAVSIFLEDRCVGLYSSDEDTAIYRALEDPKFQGFIRDFAQHVYRSGVQDSRTFIKASLGIFD